LTGLLMFNFGWFREQFCVIMCPYGRFQSVLMDPSSITVMYDDIRGEPRKGLSSAPRGDCVSCNRCVEVCPTKIDIRDGIQMECISCTACIDACNEIMRKVDKPEGLIRHKRISDQTVVGFRPRIAAYSAASVLLLVGLIFSVATRKAYSLTILRATDAPFQVLADDRVLNHFKNHYLNQSARTQTVEFVLSEDDLQRGMQLTQAVSTHSVAPGESAELHLFVSFPKALLGSDGQIRFKILVRDRATGVENDVEVTGLGPYSTGS
jgi:cytochrome c oxidase accessory protein FixG